MEIYVYSQTMEPFKSSGVRYIFVILEEKVYCIHEDGVVNEQIDSRKTLREDKYVFALTKIKWFEEHYDKIPGYQQKCSCDSLFLSRNGCKCGAFQRELKKEGIIR